MPERWNNWFKKSQDSGMTRDEQIAALTERRTILLKQKNTTGADGKIRDDIDARLKALGVEPPKDVIPGILEPEKTNEAPDVRSLEDTLARLKQMSGEPSRDQLEDRLDERQAA